MTPNPKIVIVVGTRANFKTAVAHLLPGIHSVKLSSNVKKDEMEIRDIHGHLFAVLKLKPQRYPHVVNKSSC